MNYHLGLIKGSGQCKCWANGHRNSTVVLQARRNIDYLSPDLWQYLGERETTKAQLKTNAQHILTWINGAYNTDYAHIVID